MIKDVVEDVKMLNEMMYYHLRFYTGTNSVNIPVSHVIIVYMYFGKSNTRVPLPCPIKKTMVNGYPNASISDVRWICSNEHCLVMLCETAPENSS